MQYRAVFLGFLNSKSHHPKGKSIFQKKKGMIDFLFTFRSNLVWIGVKADKSGCFSLNIFL